MKRILPLVALLVLGLTGGGRGGQCRASDLEETVSRDLPNYQPLAGAAVAGSLHSTGSALVTNLIKRWSAAFRQIYPNAEISAEGTDSGLAPTALMNKTAQVAPMSRLMTAEELAAFKKKFGYEPFRITVGADAVAIFVEKDNPISALSLQQLDSIYSRSFKRGGKSIRYWSELGVEGTLGSQRLQAFTLATNSGSSQVFQDIVMQGGEFAVDLEKPITTSSAVQGVGADPAAIALASAVFNTKRTRQVPLLVADGQPPLAPTAENVLSGQYPLSRRLYIYINKPPGQKLDPLIRELLRFALSLEGQRLVARDGNIPLTPEIIKPQLESLDH